MNGKPTITLEPTIDPQTGHVVFTDPSSPGAHLPAVLGESVHPGAPTNPGGTMATTHIDGNRIIDGELVPAGPSPVQAAHAVTLTDDRFAVDPTFDWGRADRAQDAGQAMQIIDGQLVPVGQKPAQPGQTVTLTDDRFAATASENGQIASLVRSGAASKLIGALQPTSELRGYFATDPSGWYLRTKPTPTYGDVLHTVIVHKHATGLYHAHLWRFLQLDGGQLKHVDLNRWVGSHTSLSAHNVHLYGGTAGESAVLCLSQRTNGGMPNLTGAVLQAAKWADGMGCVVRGGRFPYRQ
jgi:hypothetical protein